MLSQLYFFLSDMVDVGRCNSNVLSGCRLGAVVGWVREGKLRTFVEPRTSSLASNTAPGPDSISTTDSWYEDWSVSASSAQHGPQKEYCPSNPRILSTKASAVGRSLGLACIICVIQL